uniref:ATP-binding cassette domain-containing protein n=1 Tax=Thiomicrorhabdus sp. TaxID=2039724 RepID=UPI003561812C
MKQENNQTDKHALDAYYTPEILERFERIEKRPVAIEVKKLQKSFEHKGQVNQVLGGIDFDTYRREFMCVVGPSGCGKSTLARTIAGLETADDGVMVVAGSPVEGPGPDRGMVFQRYTLFPWM